MRPAEPPRAADGPTWTALSSPSSVRAVALAVGGLNTRSDVIFADIAAALGEQGVAVYALALSGHRVDPATERATPGAFGHVGFADWEDEVIAAGRALRAHHEGLPRLGIGYSIGGAAMLLAHVREPAFDGLVGLAPAIAMTPLTRALNRLNHGLTAAVGLERWAWRRTALPVRYRANDHVPATALITGEDAQRRFADLGTEALEPLRDRLTVIMRDGDSVISARRVRRFVAEHDLRADWCAVPPGDAWAHEVFDRLTLGDAWDRVLGRIVDRLERIIAPAGREARMRSRSRPPSVDPAEMQRNRRR
ncbi:MAG: alpha/beta hydrolase [Myxococcota bacterium]